VKWSMVKLGEVCQKVATWNPAKSLDETSFFYIDLSSVDKDRKQIDQSLVSEIYPVDAPSRARQLVKADDVLVATVRPNLNGVAVVKAEFDGATASTGYCVLRTDPKQLDWTYLFYWVQTDLFISDMMSKATGANYPAVSDRIINESLIPLPPLAEQQRIATILDKADAIRRKRQQAIQLADDFLRAVFLDMFGDPVTNPKGWEVLTFGEIGALDRGKSKHRPRNDPKLLGGDHPLIQTGDVASSGGYIKKYKSTYSDLGLYQSKKWPEGTLCITIAANIAKTGVLKFDACFPDSIVGFTPNERTTVEYVQYWLGFLQKTLEANAPESAQKNINLAILRELEIPLPDIDLQRKFSEVIQRAVSTADKLSGSSEVQVELFNSLSQKAFAGEL
jgi:type I restriction enzyme, S subunit